MMEGEMEQDREEEGGRIGVNEGGRKKWTLRGILGERWSEVETEWRKEEIW